MAQDSTGRWAAATTGREMSRQNGKGDEIEVVELWGLTQRSEAILHTVHDAVLLASQTQQRMLSTLDGHADLRRLIKRKWQGTGQQMIEMRNGGTIWYRTRTAGGGRGVDDVDRLVIDEAQHATEEHLAAVSPTLLANSNPQLNAMGTAGLAKTSAWWWTVRRRALLPDPGSFGYIGHTAERLTVENGQVVQDPVDVEDRSLWRLANPSVAAGRGGGMAFLEEQLRRLGPAAFAREHLGVWDPDPQSTSAHAAINPDLWASLADPNAPRGGAPVFGIAAAPDRDWSAVAVAWRRADGTSQVMLAKYDRGTAWVATEAERLRAQWGGTVFADSSARDLIADAEKPGSALVVAAHNALATAVEGRTVRHGNEAALNFAVKSARWKPSGDSRVLDRKGTADISPLVAAALALHGLNDTANDGGWVFAL